MKLLSLLFIPSILAASLHASAALNPSVDVNGSSFSEKQFQWVWNHRADFLKSCHLDEKECSAEGPMQDLTAKLYQGLSQTSDSQIQFKSEKTNPDLFNSSLGETHRIAVTANKPGSLIYVNTDRLAQLTLENMVGIVFHELTHHLGILDDAQRLPDQVGAWMTRHFQKNLLRSPYTGPEAKGLESAVYQFPTPAFVDEEFFFTDFGFFTDGESFLDTDFGNFLVNPGCDQAGYKIAGQRTQTPAWRNLEDKDGVRRLEVILLFNNLCYKKTSSSGADHNVAKRNYKLVLYLNSKGHMDRQAGTIERLSDSLDAYLDYISTIQMTGIQYSSTNVKTGDTLRISVQLKSFTELKPENCQLGIALEGTVTSEEGYPSVDKVPDCRISEKTPGQWELQASLPISSSMASGKYYPRLIHITGTGSDSVAFLKMPEKNGFSVVSQTATAPFSILDIQFPGIKSAPRFGPQPVTRAFSYQTNQSITLTLKIKGTGNIQIKGLTMYSIQAVNGQLETITNSGALSDFQEFQFTQKISDAGAGIKVLELKFTLPTQWHGYPLFGMGLQELILENDGFQISSWKATGPYDTMLLSEGLVQANP